MILKLDKPICRTKAPCATCPYTLGLVHTLRNPCPQCKENGYRMFEGFQRKLLIDGGEGKHGFTIKMGFLGDDCDARILRVLQTEYRCLTFDELYSKVRPDCDWTSFAGVLERLVKQGQIEYTLPYGAETGYYKIPSC